MKLSNYGSDGSSILPLLLLAFPFTAIKPIHAFAPLPFPYRRRVTSSTPIFADRDVGDGTSSIPPPENVEDSCDSMVIKGLSKMNVAMTSDFFLMSDRPSLRQLYSQCTKCVEVKESSIPGAGLGLFATKNIKSGSIVSFYPAHALGTDVEGRGPSFLSLGESDREFFRTNPCGESAYLHVTDQPIFDRPSLLASSAAFKDSPLYLDVNPNKKVTPAWVSQFINDGATVTSNSEAGLLDYYKHTQSRKNCIHMPFGPSPVMATVTTRKVKKGEELFTSYGCTYWLGVLLDVRGEEGVGMTSSIRLAIKESADDLFAGMKHVSVVYASQAEAFASAFDEIAL